MKYIVANLKDHLNDVNIHNYICDIKNIRYDNLIVCPSIKYIDLFKKSDIKVGMQDYYDENIKYVILNHYERKNSIDEVKEKIRLSILKNMTIILCVGNNDLKDNKEIKDELNEFLTGIDYENIMIAYEPYFMIGKEKIIDIEKINQVINFIKSYTNNKYKVLYGGNVNAKNIEKIVQVCDGVLIGRLGYNSDNLTKVLNKLIKSI